MLQVSQCSPRQRASPDQEKREGMKAASAPTWTPMRKRVTTQSTLDQRSCSWWKAATRTSVSAWYLRRRTSAGESPASVDDAD